MQSNVLNFVIPIIVVVALIVVIWTTGSPLDGWNYAMMIASCVVGVIAMWALRTRRLKQ